ncbi:MAG: carboxylate-amine ligase [Alphaproteobacteria bacterium BRH_c36]|nr:MAG: carboxylate-amine ligase [Alphaproteobacteria bacterium BRH_c36]
MLNLPPPTEAERQRVRELQERFARSFAATRDDRNAPRTVVIVPSLSLDQEVLARISGVHHYEERQLCMLLLLRFPRTRVIYLTSTPIAEPIIDYYLHLLPGIPAQHARRRLTLISCDDASSTPLAEKLLQRPRVLQRIRESVPDPGTAHMTCFTVTELERALGLALDLPVYGCDPELYYHGTKSGSRRLFREAGMDLPAGMEDLTDADDVCRALVELKQQNHHLKRAVIKLNDGFSGEGNAVFDFRGAADGEDTASWVGERLPRLAFEASGMTWELYSEKLAAMGGIVEEFIEGDVKRSPSAQLRIDPTGAIEAVSTHDQLLGGGNAQIFLGCRFPADETYRLEIQDRGLAVAKALAERGALGRFSVDFLSVPDGSGGWRHSAIEINLRKGGTTHPFLMLQSLTDGTYCSKTGQFLTPGGEPRYYIASDNLESELYRGLLPFDLIDIAAMNRLHWHGTNQEGVAFHLMGALSEFGKLGVVCIGPSHERADAYYRETVAILENEGQSWLKSTKP